MSRSDCSLDSIDSSREQSCERFSESVFDDVSESSSDVFEKQSTRPGGASEGGTGSSQRQARKVSAGLSARAEIIPNFQPDDKTCTASAWLHKIDALGESHSWDENAKSCYMQSRLRGSARRWYDELDDRDLTWGQWKTALECAFPPHVEYADLLEEMVGRTKRESENMTHYYHEKLVLIRRCRLDDEAAVSCIIRGLPAELQAHAKSYQCATPEELYATFLSTRENYKLPTSAPRHTWKTSDICYNCNKVGHIAKFCKLGENAGKRCRNCGKKGHVRNVCFKRKKMPKMSD